MKKNIFGILLATAMVVSLVGCGEYEPSDEEKTIKVAQTLKIIKKLRQILAIH